MRTDLHSFKRARAASRDEQAVWMRFIRTCKRNKTLRYIFIIILLLFVIFYIWATCSHNLKDLSKIGDAFNILNTFFTALAFIGLIVTILLQRKDLALQREELKLQREEMKRQCEEQKRQANEFEAQNRLMRIQQFESFFFKQLEYLNYLSKNVRINGNYGVDIFNEIADNVRDCLKIIWYPDLSKSLLSNNLTERNEINKKWRSFECNGNDLLAWSNKFYFLISYVDEIDFLNEKEKKLYFMTIMDNFSNRQKYLLQIMGQISSNKLQHKIEEKLRKGGYFHMDPNLIFGEEYEKNRRIFEKSIGLGSNWGHAIFAIIDAEKSSESMGK